MRHGHVCVTRLGDIFYKWNVCVRVCFSVGLEEPGSGEDEHC